jgi:hypothetical protein
LSYNPNIPQASSKRVISQRQILANFSGIFDAFAKNHSPLGNNDLQGMHDIMILRDQTNVGNPTTTATQVAIYNKLVSSVPNLFYRPNNSQTPIQMTYPSIQTGLQPSPPNTYFPQQYSFVAGPFVFYAGIIKNPSNGQTITLTPIVSQLRFVGVGVTNFNGGNTFVNSVVASNILANTFQIVYQTAPPGINRDVYYIAIGN